MKTATRILGRLTICGFTLKALIANTAVVTKHVVKTTVKPISM